MSHQCRGAALMSHQCRGAALMSHHASRRNVWKRCNSSGRPIPMIAHMISYEPAYLFCSAHHRFRPDFDVTRPLMVQRLLYWLRLAMGTMAAGASLRATGPVPCMLYWGTGGPPPTNPPLAPPLPRPKKLPTWPGPLGPLTPRRGAFVLAAAAPAPVADALTPMPACCCGCCCW
jgi:hypothetical protein